MFCFGCHMDRFGKIALGTPSYIGKCEACDLVGTVMEAPKGAPAVEVAFFDWPCALCGTREGLLKYEVLVSKLPGYGVAHSTPVGSFQRFLCRNCADKIDDYLMDSVDARGVLIDLPGAVNALEHARAALALSRRAVGVNANTYLLDKANEMIKMVLAGRQGAPWTGCADEMPVDEDTYQVVMANTAERYQTACRFFGGAWVDEYGRPVRGVTHWMRRFPLPEA